MVFPVEKGVEAESLVENSPLKGRSYTYSSDISWVIRNFLPDLNFRECFASLSSD